MPCSAIFEIVRSEVLVVLCAYDAVICLTSADKFIKFANQGDVSIADAVTAATYGVAEADGCVDETAVETQYQEVCDEPSHADQHSVSEPGWG